MKFLLALVYFKITDINAFFQDFLKQSHTFVAHILCQGNETTLKQSAFVVGC